MVIFPGGEDNSDNFAGLKLIPTPDTDSAVCVIVQGHMQSVSKYDPFWTWLGITYSSIYRFSECVSYIKDCGTMTLLYLSLPLRLRPSGVDL